jgi:amidophosphoribosyltransferase
MCGVFALIGRMPGADSLTTALGMLRHRGDDGFGWWLFEPPQKAGDYGRTEHHRMSRSVPSPVKVGSAVGRASTLLAHWRYATRGDVNVANVQPIVTESATAFAYNGQFDFPDPHPASKRSDSWEFARLLTGARSPALGAEVHSLLSEITGGYALVAANQRALVGTRDRFGIRPLFWARYPAGVAICSETPPLQQVGGRDISEIEAGTTIEWSSSGALTTYRQSLEKPAPCSFEWVYFHSPRGFLSGEMVSSARVRLGRRLAEECPAAGNLVTPIPMSANQIAMGFAAALDLPYQQVLSCRSTATRTFITPSVARDDAIAQKYTLDAAAVVGRSVIVVDDSLVRGTTLRFVVQLLRKAGARLIHARIASPPFRHPCFFGIDVPDDSQLVCAHKSISAVTAELGLDSLKFLSVQGLRKVVGADVCHGCFTGSYPPGSLRSGRAFDRFGTERQVEAN